MSTIREIMTAIDEKNYSEILPISLDLKGVSDNQVCELWAKAIISGNRMLVDDLSGLISEIDVESVIEILQNESVVTLSGIDSTIMETFEERYDTELLSELVEWAQEEYEENREYVETVLKSIASEFERRMYDTALGKLDPDGYSIDPDYDSMFDVNHDNGIVLKKVIEYDNAFLKKIKRAEPVKLIEALLKEGFDLSKCDTEYISSILTRDFNYKADCFRFTDKEMACIDFILDSGYEINRISKGGLSLLRYAVGTDNLEATKYLIDKGADPYAGDVIMRKVYAQKLIDIGFSSDLFEQTKEDRFKYLGKDGIMIQPAFYCGKEMLEYLNSVLGNSENYSLFLKVSDEMEKIEEIIEADEPQVFFGTKP